MAEIKAAKGKGAAGGISRLSVCARQAGFRRAGRAWPAEPVIVDAADFSAEQIAQLHGEPMLVVQTLDEGK